MPFVCGRGINAIVAVGLDCNPKRVYGLFFAINIVALRLNAVSMPALNQTPKKDYNFCKKV